MNPLLQSVQLALQNARQKEAIDFIDEVVEFCVEHENGKVFDGWEEEMIRLMVAYHWAKQTLIVHHNADETIRGVFMWYRRCGFNFSNRIPYWLCLYARLRDPWNWSLGWTWPGSASHRHECYCIYCKSVQQHRRFCRSKFFRNRTLICLS